MREDIANLLGWRENTSLEWLGFRRFRKSEQISSNMEWWGTTIYTLEKRGIVNVSLISIVESSSILWPTTNDTKKSYPIITRHVMRLSSSMSHLALKNLTVTKTLWFNISNLGASLLVRTVRPIRSPTPGQNRPRPLHQVEN